jgi:hypothetical protein
MMRIPLNMAFNWKLSFSASSQRATRSFLFRASSHQSDDTPVEHRGLCAGVLRLISACGMYDGAQIDESTANWERVLCVDRKFRIQDVTFEDRFCVIAAPPRDQSYEIG